MVAVVGTTGAADDKTPGKGGPRVVWADEAALKEYKEGTVNKTVNATIAPQLYGHAVKFFYDADDGVNRDSNENRAILKDGSWAKLVRNAIAEYVKYPKDENGKYLNPLVIEAPSKEGLILGAASTVKTTSMGMFLNVRKMIAAGIPEQQAMDMVLPGVKETIKAIAPKLEITDDMLMAWFKETEGKTTLANEPVAAPVSQESSQEQEQEQEPAAV